MNKRIVEEIKLLLQIGKNITLQDLVEQFQVSSRTIRNDIAVINSHLELNQLSKIELGVGGSIERKEDFIKIEDIIREQDFYTYRLSKGERKLHIVSILLNSPGYITLSQIADTIYVSRTTIINDLDGVKQLIQSTGTLQVLSHPNKGLRIVGTEKEKRKLLLKLGELNRKDGHGIGNMEKLLGIKSVHTSIIRKIIREQEEYFQCRLTDESYWYIELYLRLMVKRNLQGCFMELEQENKSSTSEMAQAILKYLMQYCKIMSSEGELQYLSEMLQSCHYLIKDTEEKEVLKTQMITRKFIEAISEEIEIDLNDDYDFYENLSNHLDSFFSGRNVSYPENPIFDEIMEKNMDVLEAVEKLSFIFEEEIGRVTTRLENIYIAIHICAAVERKKNHSIALRVVLACNGGVGTSQLLLARLKRNFKFQVIDVIAAHEAFELTEHEADLVITTVPLQECKVCWVKVSPLLTDEDYIRIGNKMDKLHNEKLLPIQSTKRQVTARGLFRKMKPLIRQYGGETQSILEEKLKEVVYSYFNVNTKEEIFIPRLHQVLTEPYIKLDVECNDWKDAIRKSANILLDKGYIEERYIGAMIENIEENEPYIVISQGFAVPHEGLGKGTLKMGMSLIRLKEPVCFGVEEYDPVEFVCTLSAIDKHSHFKAFFHLVNILREKGFKEELRKAKTAKEIADIIENYEYMLDEK